MPDSSSNPIYDRQLLKSLDFAMSTACEYGGRGECISEASLLAVMDCCGKSQIMCAFHSDKWKRSIESMTHPRCSTCSTPDTSMRFIPLGGEA